MFELRRARNDLNRLAQIRRRRNRRACSRPEGPRRDALAAGGAPGSALASSPSRYRLRVCTSVIATAAVRTKTTTMANASKKSIAPISVRPSLLTLTRQKDGLPCDKSHRFAERFLRAYGSSAANIFQIAGRSSMDISLPRARHDFHVFQRQTTAERSFRFVEHHHASREGTRVHDPRRVHARPD